MIDKNIIEGLKSIPAKVLEGIKQVETAESTRKVQDKELLEFVSSKGFKRLLKDIENEAIVINNYLIHSQIRTDKVDEGFAYRIDLEGQLLSKEYLIKQLKELSRKAKQTKLEHKHFTILVQGFINGILKSFNSFEKKASE